MIQKKKNKIPNNKQIFFYIFGLVVFGLVMLASASSVVGFTQFGDSYYFLKHQITYGLIPGLILFFILSKVDYKILQKKSALIFGVCLIMLVLVFIPGVGATYNQARSWINIGGMSLQPSEIMKLALLIYLAAWVNKNKEKTKSFFGGFVPFLLVVGLVAGMIAIQPDMGTMMIVVLLSVIVFFVGGARWSHVVGLFVFGLVGIFSLIKLAPYRMQRLAVFLDPSVDPQGIGYHINQALLAIGAGGFLGLGLGHSRQKFQYLPEVAGDSIFAIMAEELGFIIATLFVVVFVILVLKIIRFAKETDDNFVKLFSIGFVAWVGGQAMINIGAMVGILPLTGVPLPFISFGGTSLMTLLAASGILYNMTKKNE